MLHPSPSPYPPHQEETQKTGQPLAPSPAHPFQPAPPPNPTWLKYEERVNALGQVCTGARDIT